jgi:hypothetical protein
MPTPPGRGAQRRLLGIGVAGLLAGALSILALAPTASADPGPDVTDSPSPSDSPSPTDPAPPPPAPGVQVAASDLAVGETYWRGGGATGTITIEVTNSGEAAEDILVTYALPPGVHQSGVTTGCAAAGGGYTCGLSVGEHASVAVAVAVDPTAWRQAPLNGKAFAQASIVGQPSPVATGQTGFTVLLPPGPPAQGVSLSAGDVRLPTAAPAHETAPLAVRLGNAGTAAATAAVELVTPEGIEVATFPAGCGSHRRVGAHRERCEVGRIDAGQNVQLTFTLSIGGQARAEAPTSGAVYAYLTPYGQDTVVVQTSYRVVVASGPVPSATASPAPSTPAPAGGAGGQAPGRRPAQVLTDTLISRQLSALPIVAGVVGLVGIVGLFTVLSLRRRLQDEAIPAAPDETVT